MVDGVGSPPEGASSPHRPITRVVSPVHMEGTTCRCFLVSVVSLPSISTSVNPLSLSAAPPPTHHHSPSLYLSLPSFSVSVSLSHSLTFLPSLSLVLEYYYY